MPNRVILNLFYLASRFASTSFIGCKINETSVVLSSFCSPSTQGERNKEREREKEGEEDRERERGRKKAAPSFRHNACIRCSGWFQPKSKPSKLHWTHMVTDRQVQ